MLASTPLDHSRQDVVRSSPLALHPKTLHSAQATPYSKFFCGFLVFWLNPTYTDLMGTRLGTRMSQAALRSLQLTLVRLQIPGNTCPRGSPTGNSRCLLPQAGRYRGGNQVPLLKFPENLNRTSVKRGPVMDSSLEGKSKSNPLHLVFEALADCAHKLPPNPHHLDALACAVPSG